MRGFVVTLTAVLLMAAPIDSADAGGFAVLGGRTTVVQANGFNVAVQNRGLLGLGRTNVVVNNGFATNAVAVRSFGGFNRANVVVASPFRFNAFGTAAVVDRRGNVFQVDPFGNSVLLRSGFGSVQSFGVCRGCR